MDFRVVAIVVMLFLTTPVHGRILKRDTSPRATCTAPLATKGETAVVTCHYPLEVKQPGEIVSVSVERYPFISSSTGFPSSHYLLDCMWYEDYTCMVDEEEHRVEGEEIVITIKNVTEDSQGRYLCKMMVKDGPNIHGEACQLLVNGTNPSDLSSPTTDPAMDQRTTTDNVTSYADQNPVGDIAEIVAGCAAAVTAVVVVAIFVCKKCGAGPQETQTQTVTVKEADTVIETQPLVEDQNLHPGQKSPRPPDHGSNDDVNDGAGPQETQTQTEADTDTQIHPLMEGEEDQDLHPGQKSPRPPDHGSNDDVNKQQGSSDGCPEGLVRRERKRIDGRVTGSYSTSDVSGSGHPDRQPLQGLGAENPEEEAPGDNDDDNRGNRPQEERDPLLERGENQPPYRDPERPGARDERNNGDVNHGNGHPERQQLQGLGAENPEEEAPGDNDDDNRGRGHPERQQLQSLGAENPEEKAPGKNDDNNRVNEPPAERVPLLGRGEIQPPYRDPERPGARDERNNGDVDHENRPPAERVPLLGRGENQPPYQDPERPGARRQRNNGDDNHGNRPPAKRVPLSGRGENQLPYRDRDRPEARRQRNNDDVNHGNRPPAKTVPLSGRGENQLPYRDRDRHGARRQHNNDDVNQQQGSSDDRPEGLVRRERKRIEGRLTGSRSTSDIRQQGSSVDRPKSWVGAQANRLEGKGPPSTSHPRASEETNGTEKAW